MNTRRGWLRRRTFVIEGFQATFVFEHMLWLTAVLALVCVVAFAPMVVPLLRTSGQADLELADQFLALHHLFWPLLIAFFVLSGLVSMVLTHRVAGPLSRFRRVFSDVGRGILTGPVRVRRGDYLAREARELELMVSRLRERIRAAQAGAGDLAADAQALAALDRGATPDELRGLASRLSVHREALAEFQVDRETTSVVLEPTVDHLPAPTEPRASGAGRNRGFSLVELLIALSIIAVLLSVALPAYASALNSARIVRAIGELRSIDRMARLHVLQKGCLPSTLADMGLGQMRDPWGRPYVYAVIAKPSGGGKPGSSCTACSGGCITMGSAKKDRRLVPINSDFDAYSFGRDGKTAPSLSGAPAQDDVVRGNSGGFFGLGRDY